MPFSEPQHVPLLLSGAKMQTTRQPRKRPLKVGEILHCWFKPRQKKSCKNCIVPQSKDAISCMKYGDFCANHSNFFGKAKVTGILHFDNSKSNHVAADSEYNTYMPIIAWECTLAGFDRQPEAFMEAWARADGFADFKEAHKWFTKSTGNDQWMFLPFDVIIFKPGWV